MFYRGFTLLASHARAEGLPAPKVPAALAGQAREAAQRALSRDLPQMRVSERLADPAGWRRVQQGRRQALEALMLVEPDKPELARAIDLIGLIAEESTWSENAEGAAFDDERRPQLDFQAAETAMLLAWLARAWGEALPSRALGKVVYEARRRVFSPFLAHGDYPFMRGQGKRPLCVLADILLSAILLETDAARRGAILKQSLRLLDAVIGMRGNRPEALPDAAAETGAITDLAALLRKLSRGQVDLTADYPTPEWLDDLFVPWIDGQSFADAAAGTLRPELSGAELFRIGLAANDEALTALGAQLDRAARVPSGTVTGRLMDLSCAALLTAEGGRVPRLKYAATAGNRLMLSRFDGITCALHTGGAGNAGSLILYAGSRPILVEIPGSASLPLVAGQEQLTPERMPVSPAGDLQVREDREQLTVDLTHAYPVSAPVSAFQRTAVVLRREGVLRLVDAFELSQPAQVVFRFVTPERPEELPNGLRLGPIELTWEDRFALKAVALTARFPENAADGRSLYRIELSAAPVTHAYFGFTFAPAQA